MPSLRKKFIVAVCLLTWTKVCISQDFEINRREKKDSFTIPSSMCDRKNHNLDFCTEYNAKKVQKSNKCECFCDNHATFLFHNQAWSCLGIGEERSLLAGCSKAIFFEDPILTDRLTSLSRNSKKELSSEWKGNCTANASSSWYIGCRGNKEYFAHTQEKFKIVCDSSDSEYTLKLNLPNNDPLAGRVLNLGITCTMPGSSATAEHSCLMFKIEGKTNCPVTVPHTSKGIDEIITSTAAGTTSPQRSPTTRPPPEVKAGPSSAADQHGNDVNLSSSVGLIAAGSASLILVLIMVFLIYRLKYSRNHSHTRHAGQTGHTSHAGQTGQTGLHSGDLNAGYATISCNGSATYASNYEVPIDAQNNASLNAVNIRITDRDATEGHYEYVSTEGYQKNVPLRGVEQPEYNLIEVFNTESADETYEYIPAEGCQKDAPSAGVKQPKYNFTEVLATDTTVRSYEYVPSDEKQADAPLGSFNNQEYNLIEVFDTESTGEIHDGTAQTEEANTGIFQDHRDDVQRESVYNVLDQSSPNGAGNAGRLGTSDEQSPVYNLLCRGP